MLFDDALVNGIGTIIGWKYRGVKQLAMPSHLCGEVIIIIVTADDTGMVLTHVSISLIQLKTNGHCLRYTQGRVQSKTDTLKGVVVASHIIARVIYYFDALRPLIFGSHGAKNVPRSISVMRSQVFRSRHLTGVFFG